MDTYEGRSEDPASLHKYLYASAAPVNRIDPSGHEDLISMTGAAAIGTTLAGATAGWLVGRFVGGSQTAAVYGATGGAAIALAIVSKNPDLIRRVILGGIFGAAAQYGLNQYAEYVSRVLRMPAPDPQTERDNIFKAFGTAAAGAYLGGATQLKFGASDVFVAGGSAAITALANDLAQHKCCTEAVSDAVTAALVASLVTSLGNGIAPTFSDLGKGEDYIRDVIGSGLAGVIGIAIPPIVGTTIKTLDPRLYHFLFCRD